MERGLYGRESDDGKRGVERDGVRLYAQSLIGWRRSLWYAAIWREA